jgi:SLT domain-containing protein
VINGWIMQALGFLHKPASWAGGIFQQVMSESSGNPGIIQQIHDVNSGGNEARGLMQTTPTTFAAYMAPGHGNIFNPVDNLIAAIKYADTTYGDSWFNMGSWHAHGYDTGGILKPGMTAAYNGTGSDEYIFTGSQMAGLRGGQTVVLDIHDNTLMSDRDMDVLIDKIGRRMATFTIPAAGIHIGR